MDEQLDDTERRIRIKELQLALLRGDITLEEHDRRRARYVAAQPPAGEPVKRTRGGTLQGAGMIFAALYILTILGANWAITTWGLVPVGFGFMAPAGVYFAGLAFTLRDLTQDRLGKGWTIGAILVGAALSALLSPALALASGAAFLLSELADFAVYTPLRRRSWLGAVALSNTVGLVLDSVIFLALAFGSLAFLPGQLVGKGYMTALAVALLWGYRRVVSQRDRAGGDAAVGGAGLPAGDHGATR